METVTEFGHELADAHVCTAACARYLSGRYAAGRNVDAPALVHAQAVQRAHPCWARGYTDASHGLTLEVL